MPIDGYTTTVKVSKTLDAVMSLLAKYKVRAVQTLYNEAGEPEGLSFTLHTRWGPRDFVLPINAAGVLETLKRDRAEKRFQTLEQANRVAWRIALKWLQAQLAIIDAGMATLDEVFFPYLVIGVEGDRPITAYSRYASTQKVIEA